MEISNRKESSANINGDGPSKKNNSINEKNLQLPEHFQNLAMLRNGINIYRTRLNCPFKISALDIELLQTKLPNSTDCTMGYIVTKINETDILKYTNLEAAKLLATTNIFSIETLPPTEHNKLLRKSRTVLIRIMINITIYIIYNSWE